MQTTPASGFVPNGHLGSTRTLISIWALVFASCCAALVALASMYVSFTLAREALDANTSGATPSGPLLQTINELHAAWLICGVAGLLSWSCAFVASRIAAAAPRGARRTATALLMLTLVLSSLALVGLACFFGWYELVSYAQRIG